MNVSLICSCKNRYKALLVSLGSWLLYDEIKEIIIVDWDSDEPINHITKIDPRIKVIRVSNQKYFNQPQPLNLALSVATGDYIFKADTDYLLNPYHNFFQNYRVDENTFISGHQAYKSPEFIDPQTGLAMFDKSSMSTEDLLDYANSYSHFFKYLTGMLLVSRKHLIDIGGYNENFGKYYAFEDDEICKRLENLGLNHIKLKYDHNLIHLPHPDIKRVENFEGYNETEQKEWIHSIEDDVERWQAEYFISQTHINLNKESVDEINYTYVEPKTKWELQKMDDQNYFAEMVVNDKLKSFPTAYYVSLEESKDRQENIEKQFSSYGIELNSIISKRFSECNDKISGKYVFQLNEGTIGCVISHLKAIKQWYETTNEDYGFFCEDDLSLETLDYWNFNWESFVNGLPEDWDCVQLIPIRGNYDQIKLRDRYWDDWSVTAYILKRDYAKKIIDNYIVNDVYNLEIKGHDVMPLIENILFTNLGKTYTIPLLTEDTKFQSTFVGKDDDVKDGQKRNHYFAQESILNWWKENGKKVSLTDLGLIDKNKSFNEFEGCKIIDCFPYFNEKELLELRINLLKDHVDKFVITDANYTHSGIEKPFTCKKVLEELNLLSDKIYVIEKDLSDEYLGTANEYDLYYNSSLTLGSRERIQRDAFRDLISKFDDDAVFIVSDCDEIINPKYIKHFADTVVQHQRNIIKVSLDHLEGSANYRVYNSNANQPLEWKKSLYFCSKHVLTHHGPTQVRADYYVNDYIVFADNSDENYGWHFSWMGDNQNRLLKSQSFCHSDQDLTDIIHTNYSSDSMINFMKKYIPKEGGISPSGNINHVLKKYPKENLPEIIFSLPRVEKYLFPETEKTTLTQTKQEIKSDLEQLLTIYSLDTENPEHNFALGVWYENQGHTAPALSYFLRCAERAEDNLLAYEGLIRASYCYDKQGTRDGSAKSLLQQALCLMPNRPEAYFLLSRFSEKRQWWQDTYIYADTALRICDFCLEPLRTDVEYPGKYGLLFEKAISGYWWGKDKECRKLFQEIKNNYNLAPEYYKLVEENLMRLASGHVPEEEIKYNKNRYDELKYKFEGCENIKKNHSQAFQDMFILAALNGKKNGLYLEIGAQEPFYQNNTALLETNYDWNGISIEIREDLCRMFAEQRKNTILCKDATTINYENLLDEFNQGTVFDFLQVDCEPSKTTFEILLSIPFNKYKFAIITYEHDHYVDMTNSYREKSRKYLEMMGYELLVSNVSPNENSPFEDWWVHPDLIPEEVKNKMRSIQEVTDIRKYMFN